jgi:hypothetical protein
VLSESTVRQLLSGELPQLGSYGGVIGDFLSGDAIAGPTVGASPRTAPHVYAGLTRVEQTIPCPLEPAIDALQAHFAAAMVGWRVQNGRLFAVCKFVSGFMGTRSAIVEILHDARQAHLIAHAAEGLTKHRSGTKALDRVAGVLVDLG